MGKSNLNEFVTEEAQRQNMKVYQGDAFLSHQNIPYHLFRNLFRHLLGEVKTEKELLPFVCSSKNLLIIRCLILR